MPMLKVSRSTVRAAVCGGLIAGRLLCSPLAIRRVLSEDTGCEQVQGDYVSCPLPAGDMKELWRSGCRRAVKTSDELTARTSALS
jgi:hypothetical protein